MIDQGSRKYSETHAKSYKLCAINVDLKNKPSQSDGTISHVRKSHKHNR